MPEHDQEPWRVVNAEFVKSAAKADQYPEARPSVAFAGRSNAGKSSLMNKLMARKRLAKTSSTPGCTQLVNFFGIDEKYFFIDLPGYGFAKMPKEQQRIVGGIVRQFFEKATALRLVVVLLDARRAPSQDDLNLVKWLNESEKPYVFAVTKCDKLGTNDLAKSLAAMRKTLKVGAEHLIPTSSLSGKGIEDLLAVIGDALEEAAPEAPTTHAEQKDLNQSSGNGE